jgi:hypothetical protein
MCKKIYQAINPNFTHKFNTIPIKNSASYFADIHKRIPKFIWKSKRHKMVNLILKEMNKVDGRRQTDQYTQ